MLCYVILYSIILYSIILYHIILYFILSYYIILCYVVLYYIKIYFNIILYIHTYIYIYDIYIYSMVKNLKEGVWQTLTLDKWAIETSDTSPRKECSKITWTLNWPPLITGAISSKIWLVQGLVSAFPQAMRWLNFTDPTVDFFHLFNRNICWCVQPTHPF